MDYRCGQSSDTQRRERASLLLEWISNLDWAAIAPFIAIGFAAQMVDGALGMAFGIISSTLLVSVMGVPPARAWA